jgi:hypothetical protein
MVREPPEVELEVPAAAVVHNVHIHTPHTQHQHDQILYTVKPLLTHTPRLRF